MPVVYSAKNSGVGSFHEYQVGTYIMEGLHNVVGNVRNSVAIDPADANRDRNVYTLVPAIIHNDPTNGPRVEAVELYSRPGSELHPTVQNGKVSMDTGPENSDKL